MPVKAHLPGGTERATKGAAGLRRNTDGCPCATFPKRWIEHQHRLDQGLLHAVDYHVVNTAGFFPIQIPEIPVDGPAHGAGHIIVVHHAGRNGEARGTSKREDAAFWVIALDDAKKHTDDKTGARFISRFTKPSRNTQEEVAAFEWHLVTDETTGLVSIGDRPAQTLDVFRSIIEAGVSKPIEIAKEMKLPDYTISRLAKKAVDAGWLRKSKRGEYELLEGAK